MTKLRFPSYIFVLHTLISLSGCGLNYIGKPATRLGHEESYHFNFKKDGSCSGKIGNEIFSSKMTRTNYNGYLVPDNDFNKKYRLNASTVRIECRIRKKGTTYRVFAIRFLPSAIDYLNLNPYSQLTVPSTKNRLFTNGGNIDAAPLEVINKFPCTRGVKFSIDRILTVVSTSSNGRDLAFYGRGQYFCGPI